MGVSVGRKIQILTLLKEFMLILVNHVDIKFLCKFT